MSLAASEALRERARLAGDDGEALAGVAGAGGSTAALRARRFVWKAISSMTEVMSEIFWLACSMQAMASTASRTMPPPSAATPMASSASSTAWRGRTARRP
ncbi:MAG: hypothetical protein U1E62_10585 [Alsobacter sp.]